MAWWNDGSSLANSLVDLWKLDEASGNRAGSVGSNTLTDNNTVTSGTGRVFSTAAQFTAANSEYLSIADNATVSVGNIDFFVTAWVYLTEKTSVRNIASQYNNTTNQRAWRLYYDNVADRFSLSVSADGGATVTTVTANSYGSVPLNTWILVIAAHDPTANTISISINGRDTETASHTTGVFNSNESFKIGAQGTTSLNTPGFFWNGLIGPVGFGKNYTLTAQDRINILKEAPSLAVASWWLANSQVSSAHVKEHVELPDIGQVYAGGSIADGQPWTVAFRSFSYLASANALHYAFDSQDGQFVAGISNSSSYGFYNGTTWTNAAIFNTAQEQIWFFVSNGSTIQAYLNNVAVGSPSSSSIGLDVTGLTRWASAYDNSGAYWNNPIQFGAVYDIALDSFQRRGLYQIMRGVVTDADDFTATGSWTAPYNLTQVTARVWGGGGAGGGNVSTQNASRGGGGGGGFGSGLVTVIGGNTYTVTVGAASSGNTGNGNNGNSSSFIGENSESVSGGGGTSGSLSTGGTGGVGGGSAATTTATGGHGGARGGTGASTSGGGGGAGASALGNGANGGAGHSGDSLAVAGGTGAGGAGSGGTSGSGDIGSTGTNAGGGGAPGGGGGGTGGGVVNRNGGNGARGQVTLTWVYPSPPVEAAPSPDTSVGTTVAPTSVKGSIASTPTTDDSVGTVVAPTTIKGSIALTPSTADSVGTALGETVKNSVSLSPSPTEARSDVVAPDVGVAATLDVSTPAEAGSETLGPTVERGSATIEPTNAGVGSRTLGGSVPGSGATLMPDPADEVGAVAGPTTVKGLVSPTTAPAEAIAGQVNPTIIKGGIAISPTAAGVRGSTLTPTILKGSLVFVLNASAGSETILGGVFTGGSSGAIIVPDPAESAGSTHGPTQVITGLYDGVDKRMFAGVFKGMH